MQRTAAYLEAGGYRTSDDILGYLGARKVEYRGKVLQLW
jgi:hypothetical protein